MSRQKRQARNEAARTEAEAAREKRIESRQAIRETAADKLESLSPVELRHLAALAIVGADIYRAQDQSGNTATWAYITSEYAKATALATLAVAQCGIAETNSESVD